MPEHIKTLIIILALALPFLLLARIPAMVHMEREDYLRRRNLWLWVTLSAFLAHNFWIYIAIAGILLHQAGRKDARPMGLYFFLLFAVPALPNPVPGFGVINYFFDMDYHRLLSLAVLAPAALALRRDKTSTPIGHSAADKMLLAYMAYALFLVYLAGTFTNFLRMVFTTTLDIFLPYYVASRALRSVEDFRDALMAFVVAAMAMALTGIAESILQWLLYAPLKESLDAHVFGHPLMRDGSMRAEASTGQPIPFGYVMAVALGFFLFLQNRIPVFFRITGLLLLLTGLIVSYSRGPWLGAMLIALLYLATGRGAALQLFKLALLGALALGLLMATPYGEKIVGLLPFVGSSEGETVDYRQQLLETFVPIVLDNPFFGASAYLYSPAVEALRQGDGIIDIVNSYLFVALYNGLVGLGFFMLFFIAAGTGTFRALRLTQADSDEHRLGQCLLAALAGVLFIIFTVSSISVIPLIYWTLAGMGSAYVAMVRAPARVADRNPLPGRPPLPALRRA